MSTQTLPTLNAILNGCSFLLVLSGFFAIKTGRKGLHRLLMIGAIVCSAVFLASYLLYHARVGHVAYTGEGLIRWVYFTILISHTALSVLLLPLLGLTVQSALRGQWETHRRWVKFSLPVWSYVSVTGVVVYLFVHSSTG